MTGQDLGVGHAHEAAKEFVKTPYWCPYCGAQAMYMRHDDFGDYYMGVCVWCQACKSQTYNLDVPLEGFK